MADAVRRGDIGAIRAVLQGTEPVELSRPAAADRLAQQKQRHDQAYALAHGKTNEGAQAEKSGPSKYQVLKGVREAERGGYAEMKALLALEMGEEQEGQNNEQYESHNSRRDRGRHSKQGEKNGRTSQFRGQGQGVGSGGGGVNGNSYAAQLSRRFQAESLAHSRQHSQTQPEIRQSQSQQSYQDIGKQYRERMARAKRREDSRDRIAGARVDTAATASPLKRYVKGAMERSRSNVELNGRSTDLYRDFRPIL